MGMELQIRAGAVKPVTQTPSDKLRLLVRYLICSRQKGHGLNLQCAMRQLRRGTDATLPRKGEHFDALVTNLDKEKT